MHDGEVDEIEPQPALSDQDQVAATFARLALEMHDAGGVEETVQAVVEFALQAVDCQYAGVALYAKGGIDSLFGRRHG